LCHSLREIARIYFPLVFSQDPNGVLIAADSREARMAQSIVGRPFQKLDAGDEERDSQAPRFRLLLSGLLDKGLPL